MSGTGAPTVALTDIDIANMALLAAGARGTIASFQETRTEARYARLYYNQTRDAMLRAAHWNFARKTDYLTIVLASPGTPENPGGGTPNWVPGQQPPPPWIYEYAYPADCVLMRYVSPQIPSGPALQGLPVWSAPSWVPTPNMTLQPQRFQVAVEDKIQGQAPQRVVLCNQEQAIAVYTARIGNPALWDDGFRDGFIAALAKRLCIPVSGNQKLLQGLNQEAVTAINTARLTDGNEGLTFAADVDRPPDWIRIRGFAGDWTTGSYYTMAWSNPSFLLI